MNPREKIIGIVLAVAVGGFVVYAIADNLLLAPAAQKEERLRHLEDEIGRLERANARSASLHRRMRALGASTYGPDADRVSEQIRTRILNLIHRSGLSDQNLTLNPTTGKRIYDATPIGWNIQRKGRLSHVVNFLYLLDSDPHLHRLDNLVLTPRINEGQVEFQVKFLALVLGDPTIEGPKGKKEVLATNQVPSGPAGDLNGPQREAYEKIVARDLFRPYVKRPQPTQVVSRPPERPDPPARQPEPPPSAPPPPDARFKVVGLPSWSKDTQDIFIRDTETGEMKRYKKGDRFRGGTIVMVDYRRLPMPGKPDLLSDSRAILRFGHEYWAVELGQNLAQRRRMRSDQLPPELRRGPKGKPAHKSATRPVEEAAKAGG